MIKTQLKPVGSNTPVEVHLSHLDPQSPHVYTYQLGDKMAEVVAESEGDGRGWLRIAGRVVPYFVTRKDQRVDVWIDGAIHSFDLVERTARRATGMPVGGPKTTLTAPMPGTVLKINVAAGDAFAAHQPLVILESMKMEMTLSVPHGGVVQEITCRPGQLVDMGALLARIEPAKKEST